MNAKLKEIFYEITTFAMTKGLRSINIMSETTSVTVLIIPAKLTNYWKVLGMPWLPTIVTDKAWSDRWRQVIYLGLQRGTIAEREEGNGEWLEVQEEIVLVYKRYSEEEDLPKGELSELPVYDCIKFLNIAWMKVGGKQK